MFASVSTTAYLDSIIILGERSLWGKKNIAKQSSCAISVTDPFLGHALGFQTPGIL